MVAAETVACMAAVQAFGELVRKLWSPRLFKGHVSPHELLQAISTASKKQFTSSVQADPREFLTWFLNELHHDLGGTKAPGSSAIARAFQGMVEVTTSKLRVINQDTDSARPAAMNEGMPCPLPPPRRRAGCSRWRPSVDPS